MIEKLKLFEDEPVKKDPEKKDLRIIDYIPIGEAHSVSMFDLSLILEVDERTVRSMVMADRINGAVICSGDSGYFLPVYAEDVIQWISRQEAALKSKSKTLKSARAALAAGKYPSCEEQE